MSDRTLSVFDWIKRAVLHVCTWQQRRREAEAQRAADGKQRDVRLERIGYSGSVK